MSWPFADWHRLAVTHLSLSPDTFWALPLRDWLDLITPNSTPMNGRALRDLMEDYPDE